MPVAPDLAADPDHPVHLAEILPDDTPIIVTIGYIAPGIEMVLHSMELLGSEHPDLHYVVAGRTHPDLARRDGERYRWCLAALADDLDLADRVHFLDRPVDTALNAGLLERCDAMVVPYRSAEHALVRTITAASLARRPVVTTRPCIPTTSVSGRVVLAVDVDDDEACAAAIHRVVALRRGRMADMATTAFAGGWSVTGYGSSS